MAIDRPNESNVSSLVTEIPSSIPVVATNTLILTNLVPDAFERNGSKVKELLSTYGHLSRLVILKSFGRMLAVFAVTLEAKQAKESLHRTLFLGKELRVYYGQHTESRFLNPNEGMHLNTLAVPEPEKNFLLSPPGSPPIGWVQTRENEPVLGGLDDSLLEHALSAVSLCDFQLEGGEEVYGVDQDTLGEGFSNKNPIKVLQFGESSENKSIELPSIVINLSIDELDQDEDSSKPRMRIPTRKTGMPVTARPPLPSDKDSHS